jgi:glycerol kinase
MDNPLILAIDQGTTSSRTILFDHNFSIKSIEQKEIILTYPHNGWVEQDALAIWHDVRDMVQKSIREYPSIKAIGITNQRETIVLWDKLTGTPIAPAIVWQDRRTADNCEQLKEAGKETIISQKTGLLLDPYFSASKLKWLLDNVKDARKKANNNELLCGTMDSWILWNLTGGKIHATDATNASRTMLYNIYEHKWDEELLSLFDIPATLLPEVFDSVTDFGTLNQNDFEDQIPIKGIAGDQQAALIGQAGFNEGDIKSTYGTGCFMLFNCGQKPISSNYKLLTTIAYQIKGKTTYALEGSIFIAGAAIQFLRDQFKFLNTAQDSDAMALSVPDSNDVYFVPALTGMGAPYWDSHARGAIFGLTRDTKPEHIVRAALEAQSYQTFDLITIMQKDTNIKLGSLKIDGGLSHSEFMAQDLADILDCTIDVPEILESTALGAAMLASLGIGLYKDFEDLRSIRQTKKLYKPQMSQTLRHARLKKWHDHIKRLLYTPV